MYSAAANVNDARRAERLPGHQCLDYLVKRPLINKKSVAETKVVLHTSHTILCYFRSQRRLIARIDS